MPCPICDHTLECIFSMGHSAVYQCPRCGTSEVVESEKERGAYERKCHIPKLVERCREYRTAISRLKATFAVEWLLDKWNTIGIAESIHPPEQ